MIKKTLLLLLTTSIFSTSFAQDNFSLKSVEEKGDTLVIKMKPETVPPFYFQMRGMLDNKEQSINRGKIEGVALQYFLSSQAIETAQVDKKALIEDVNVFVAKSGRYFKKHPELKGAFVVSFMILPGYKTPYQIDISKIPSSQKDEYQHINENIKKHTVCNQEKMCAITVSFSGKYINSDPKLPELDLSDFQKEVNKDKIEKNIDVFSHNKNFLQPIPYFLILGTNGYHLEKEEVEQLFKAPK